MPAALAGVFKQIRDYGVERLRQWRQARDLGVRIVVMRHTVLRSSGEAASPRERKRQHEQLRLAQRVFAA